MSSIVQTVAPATQPVSLDELKLALRVTDSDFDSMLEMYLLASVNYCQEYQWAQYITATFVERFDCFPCEFRPQRCPVISVTSIAYNDSSGNPQTLTANTDYTVDVYSKPARITPAYGRWWPAIRNFVNDVTLTYVAGYGDATVVPDEIRQAILMKSVQLYSACGDQTAMDRAIHALLDKRSFRVFY